MKVEFKASFAKDLRNIKEKNVLECVKDIIQSVEKAGSLSDIQNLKNSKAAAIAIDYGWVISASALHLSWIRLFLSEF